jgi:hypothetical protein
MESLGAFGLFASTIVFLISIIVIWSIVSIANSNVRIRKGIENIHKEIHKSNAVNDVHEKWNALKIQQKEERNKKV